MGVCHDVDGLKRTIPRRVEPDSEEWVQTRTRDVKHLLDEDCTDCGPFGKSGFKRRGSESSMSRRRRSTMSLRDQLSSLRGIAELGTSPIKLPRDEWDDELELLVRRPASADA
jgi:hypothetical protein